MLFFLKLKKNMKKKQKGYGRSKNKQKESKVYCKLNIFRIGQQKRQVDIMKSKEGLSLNVIKKEKKNANDTLKQTLMRTKRKQIYLYEIKNGTDLI